MSRTIAVLGTLDTKGAEHQFVAQQIQQRGHQVLLIDVGTGGSPTVKPDIPREEVARSAGWELDALGSSSDRGQAVASMAQAAATLVSQLHDEGRISGIISLGGGGGTSIGTAAMRALPIGFPKLMVSTVASGNTASYVGTKDIVMFPSIVDVAGLNRLSRLLFTRAAGAICGMVEAECDEHDDRPLIVASMFGNTTECIEQAKAILQREGYEVLVFHATGTGGRSMEDLIQSGMVAGVLDVTTTELADELLGGIMSAGPTRLEAAAETGVPAVIAPGCLDMANFGPRETVPQGYQSRTLYQHNADNTLLRTTAEECRTLGERLAQRVNRSTGPVTILLPRKAISVISAEGQPFYDAEADRALFEAIEQTADCPVISLDTTINSPDFAKACAEELLRLIGESSRSRT